MTTAHHAPLALVRALVVAKIARWRLALARARMTLARSVLWIIFIGGSWTVPAPVLRWAAENALEKEPRP